MDSQLYDYYGQQTPGYSHFQLQMMNQMPQRQGMVENPSGMGMQHPQMSRFNSLNMQQQQRMGMQSAAGMSVPPGHMPPYGGSISQDRVSPSMMSGRGDMQMPMNSGMSRATRRQPYMPPYHPMGPDDYGEYNDPNLMYMNGSQYGNERMMMPRGVNRMSQPYRSTTSALSNVRGRKLLNPAMPKSVMPTSPMLKQTLPTESSNGMREKEPDNDFIQSILNTTGKNFASTINLDSSLNTSGNYDLKSIITLTSDNKNILTMGIDCNDLGKFTATNPSGKNYFYSHFVSPWKEDVSPSPSFYMLPRCYNDPNNVITLFKDVQKEFFDYVERDSTEEPESIRNLDDTTLIYIFYAFPRDLYQLAAAYFLYKRGLLYHKQQQRWYQFSTIKSDTAGLSQQYSSILYFEVSEWKFLSSNDISKASPEFMSLSEIVSSIKLAKSTYSTNQE